MKKLAVLLVLALAALTLVACGGSDDSNTGEASEASGAAAETSEGSGGEEGGGGSTIEFEADPGGDLAYTSDEVTAKAGAVTLDFNNPQGLTHDVAIEDEAGETVGQTDLIADEETSTTVKLKPGKYTFYCTVPGHREAGMEGTLVVE